ncbi:uncharacterized protein isoform X1 [Choristoneura fumiferana]|uniref:uncharacterized protein isoform X1 n=1 Tax=Choristoneura fumiferana TaxID=7141 RepID=UPI003D15B0EC
MYIYGDQTVPVPEDISFSKFMLDRLRAVKGNEICLENGQTREGLTYKEATQYAVNLSVALSKLGVRRGDVVAIGSKPFYITYPRLWQFCLQERHILHMMSLWGQLY